MVAVDTNVLVYAEGVGDAVRWQTARQILSAIPSAEFVLPAQVIAELAHVLGRKTALSLGEVREKVRLWERDAAIAPTQASTLEAALDLAAEHGLQVFDAIILAAASEADCRMLLSEDMQDGFVWRGVTVVNPFAATAHPLLADLLRH
jgi:predicted nucleic acid-binding protein